MQQEYEIMLHEVELANWWSRGRQDAILKILSRYPRHVRICDIGCSSGALMQQLKARGFTSLAGIDISARAVEAAKKRGFIDVKEAAADATAFSDNSFDIVIASDILEHVKDDGASIREWLRILKPEGILVLFVPAFPFLWSGHDVVLHHQRRYLRKPLVAMLTKNGFEVKKSFYWDFLLFFPKVVISLIGRFAKSKEKPEVQHLVSGPINWILTRLLLLENFLLFKVGVRYPVGVSIGIVAKKPS